MAPEEAAKWGGGGCGFDEEGGGEAREIAEAAREDELLDRALSASASLNDGRLSREEEEEDDGGRERRNQDEGGGEEREKMVCWIQRLDPCVQSK